jgi:malonyl-CoA O-methyltransferase
VIKKHIAQSFGKASQTYDQDAPVQQWTSAQLSQRIADTRITGVTQGLEIGCGTGFLTEKLVSLLPDTSWVISDLSPDMLQQCQNRLGDVGDFIVMDGEHPDSTSQYDLIASSLAVQWFLDLEAGLKELSTLLKPGGRMFVTTLGFRSFEEWRHNLTSLDLPVGLHSYPSVEDIKKFSFEDCRFHVDSILRLQPYENGLDFLKALKNIGAQKPTSDYSPMSAGNMRRAIKALETVEKCEMTYEILFLEIQKAEI